MINFSFSFVLPSTSTSTSSSIKLKNRDLNMVYSLESFLDEAHSLGDQRFVVVGNGAILEATSSFNYVRYSDSPKGKLATFSERPKGETNQFELHIRLTQVHNVKFLEIEKFDKELRVIRFLGRDDVILLSCILQSDNHINKWNELKEKYSNSLIDMI